MWYNAHSDFFYKFIHGDKETFHIAFRKIDQEYAMPSTPLYPLPFTMCQHDFGGKLLFQHRSMMKWDLNQENVKIPGFMFEGQCLKFLDGLRKLAPGSAILHQWQ